MIHIKGGGFSKTKEMIQKEFEVIVNDTKYLIIKIKYIV